jgi:hypothetical protein
VRLLALTKATRLKRSKAAAAAANKKKNQERANDNASNNSSSKQFQPARAPAGKVLALLSTS